MPPLIPREAIREERAGDNLVHLHKTRHERQREAALEPVTGAVSAVRSARLSSGHRPLHEAILPPGTEHVHAGRGMAANNILVHVLVTVTTSTHNQK